MSDPAALRKSLLARRRAIPVQDATSAGERAGATAVERLAIPRWKGARVALYRPMPGEIDPLPMARALQAAGAELVFARVMGPGEIGMARADVSEPSHWSRGAFGLLEPSSERPTIDPATLALILVPGVAFGPRGERMGMGAGFYDRFAARWPGPVRLALAHDFQLLPALEQNPWDAPVDWVVTESREALRTPGRNAGEGIEELRSRVIEGIEGA